MEAGRRLGRPEGRRRDDGALHQYAGRRGEGGRRKRKRRSSPANFNPFTGPINKQDGTEFLAKDAVAEDEALLGMNFYVKGIDDQLPK